MNNRDARGRHRRDAGGRHRPSVEALRVVENPEGGWSLAPAIRSTHYVGRVGALAVAMGIGGAIVALPAVAVADSMETGSAESADSAPARPGQRSDNRPGFAAPETDSSSETASTADSPGEAQPGRNRGQLRDSDRIADAGESPGRRAVQRSAAARTSIRDSDSGRPPAFASESAPSAPVDAPTGVIDIAPEGFSAPDTAPEDVTDDAANTDAVPTSPLVTSVAATVADAPAIMTAAPDEDLAETDHESVDRLADGDPLAPIATPLAWAALAVSRRELSAAATTADMVAPTESAALSVPADPMASAAPTALATSAVSAASFIDDIWSVITDAGEAVWNAAQSSYQSFATLFSNASEDGVLTWLWNGLTTPLQWAVEELIQVIVPEWAPLASVLVPAVVNGFGDWIFNGTVAPQVDQIVSSPVIQQFVAGLVTQVATTTGLPTDVSVAAGDAAATWMVLALGGPQNTALRAEFDTLIANLPGLPSGWDVAQLLWNMTFNGYTFAELIEDQVDIPTQTAISTFLNTPAVQEALSAATAGAVRVLTGSASPPWQGSASCTAVPDYVGAVAGQTVAAALVGDGPAAAGVSAAVSTAVAGLVSVISEDLARVAGSALVTFLSQPGTADALAITVVNAMRSEFGLALVPVPAIGAALGATITEVAGSLLSNPDLGQTLGTTITTLIADLAADPALRDLAATEITQQISAALGDTPSTAALGAALSNTVTALLAEPAITGAIAALTGSVLPTFLSQPDVGTTLADAAGQLAAALLAGTDPGTALQNTLGSLQSTPAIGAALGATITEVIGSLLSNPDLGQTLGATITTLIAALTGDPAIRNLIGEQITEFITVAIDGGASGQQVGRLVAAALGSSPAAVAVGEAVGDAVVGLLAESAVGEGLSAVVGIAVATFLSQPGIGTALTTAVDQMVAAVLAGVGLNAALQDAVQALQTDPVIVAAFGATITATLAAVDVTLLGDSPVQQALGTTTTTVIAELAGNPAVRAALGELLGTTFGPAVVAVLGSPAVSDDGAAVIGAAITELLGHPGLSTALTGAANEIADALLAGTELATALTTALTSLQADAAFLAAVSATVPGTVDSIVGNADIRDALGAAAQIAVGTLLRDAGITNGVFGAVAGQVTNAAAVSLLARPAAAHLLSTVAIDILSGVSVNDVVNVATQAVLRDAELQVALGYAVGAGIGSLFGNNLVGLWVSQAVGATASIVISVAAALTRMFSGGGPVIGTTAMALAADDDTVAVLTVSLETAAPPNDGAPILLTFRFSRDQLFPLDLRPSHLS